MWLFEKIIETAGRGKWKRGAWRGFTGVKLPGQIL